MKKIVITILLLGLVAVGSTSCELSAKDPATVQPTTVLPDSVKVLEKRVETERELRIEAEDEASAEVILRERWQLAAIALGGLVLVGFLAGTGIGSRGKRHATVA